MTIHEAGDTTVSPASSSPDDELVQAVEAATLGTGPRFTRAQVAEQTGMDLERLTRLWRGLGFASPGHPEDALFTEGDVSAIRALQTLGDLGVIPETDEASMARMMGRTYSRLAAWEVEALAPQLDGGTDPALVGRAAETLLPLITTLQDHVWRRHLASAAGRAILARGSDHVDVPPDQPGAPLVVGFADIVGFTRNTRALSPAQLKDLVERFEATTTEIVASAHGRIVKTIGDEVLFLAGDPATGAAIASALVRRHGEDDAFPELRVGIAWGPVLNRLGDVFGETVNIAARLTSQARPGTVLVNRGLAEALEGAPAYALRRTPNAHVKGYSRLEMWALRPGEEPGANL